MMVVGVVVQDALLQRGVEKLLCGTQQNLLGVGVQAELVRNVLARVHQDAEHQVWVGV